ncbi:MAG: hypothetical protein Q7S63_02670, partial [bacterium]|nr:hypothetical protein [bacterium]
MQVATFFPLCFLSSAVKRNLFSIDLSTERSLGTHGNQSEAGHITLSIPLLCADEIALAQALRKD